VDKPEDNKDVIVKIRLYRAISSTCLNIRHKYNTLKINMKKMHAGQNIENINKNVTLL